MRKQVVAWLGLASLVGAGLSVGGGCSGADSTDPNGQGTCGNGIPEAGEQCDDGNTNDDDGCSNACQLTSCGDGIVQSGEDCDDGNSVNDDGCDNTCRGSGGSCNNDGNVDEGEQCDDGNMVDNDDCTNSCTTPRCGDGIVQAGEDCDDGNQAEFDMCPPDCMDPGGQGGDCGGQLIYAGIVTNDTNPTMPGNGVPSVWSYGGAGVGIASGNEMCAAIGADHVCTYKELRDADAAGELNGKIDEGQEFWLHRVTETVPQVGGNGMTAPGAGGRCNDWAYPTNHISDGEFAVFHPTMTTDKGRRINNIIYFFDDDTSYDAMNATGVCGANAASATDDGNLQAGCGGGCGGTQPKAIACCYAACE